MLADLPVTKLWTPVVIGDFVVKTVILLAINLKWAGFDLEICMVAGMMQTLHYCPIPVLISNPHSLQHMVVGPFQ